MHNTAIAIFAFRRPNHLRNLLESLRTNSGLHDFDIYLFIDGPRDSGDVPLNSKVQEIALEYSSRIQMKVVKAERNIGLQKSIRFKLDLLFTEYESVIVLEDDLEVSSNFLSFMSDSLDFFASDQRIASVSGYSYPLAKEASSGYLLPGADCWGWATWRDRWAEVVWDANQLARAIAISGRQTEFNLYGSYDYSGLLIDSKLNLVDSWAIYWHASMFVAGRYTFYPSSPYVINKGFDGSGTHFSNPNAISHPDAEVSESEYILNANNLPILTGELAKLYESRTDSSITVMTYRVKRSLRRLESRIKSAFVAKGKKT